MAIPSLTFIPTIISGKNRLSYNEGYNTANIRYYCDMNFKHFMARITYQDEEYGLEKGTKLSDNTNGIAGTIYNFDIVANTDMTQGDGVYRIGLYVQSWDGTWNTYYLFITINDEYVKDTDEKYLAVAIKGDVD